MSTRGAINKISISLDQEDLLTLRKRADERHDGNLSAAVAESAQLLREQEGREALLTWIGDEGNATPEERAALLAEMSGDPPKRPKATRPAQATPAKVAEDRRKDAKSAKRRRSQAA